MLQFVEIANIHFSSQCSEEYFFLFLPKANATVRKLKGIVYIAVGNRGEDNKRPEKANYNLLSSDHSPFITRLQ